MALLVADTGTAKFAAATLADVGVAVAAAGANKEFRAAGPAAAAVRRSTGVADTVAAEPNLER